MQLNRKGILARLYRWTYGYLPKQAMPDSLWRFVFGTLFAIVLFPLLWVTYWVTDRVSLGERVFFSLFCYLCFVSIIFTVFMVIQDPPRVLGGLVGLVVVFAGIWFAYSRPRITWK